MAKQKINDGHYLELMDRISIQTDVIHDYIYEHPLTNYLPQTKEKIETALTNLYEAYQLVGNAEHKKTKKK